MEDHIQPQTVFTKEEVAEPQKEEAQVLAVDHQETAETVFVPEEVPPLSVQVGEEVKHEDRMA